MIGEMRVSFSDKLLIGVLAVLQGIVFYLWCQAVAKGGVLVFNNLGLNDVWFLPVAVLLFLVLNVSLGVFIFGRNYFLKYFLLFFSFVLCLLEMVILGYYVIAA